MAQLPQPSFTLIVQLHHLQAMLQLGLIPNPATGKPNPPNPAKARHELALLEILEEKTQGNLTDEEQKLLDEVITATRNALDPQE
jgi:hypothetical protein